MEKEFVDSNGDYHRLGDDTVDLPDEEVKPETDDEDDEDNEANDDEDDDED